MMTLEILDVSADGFAAVLSQVADDQWDAPTGNEGRTVRQLVDHVVGGNRMATAILADDTRDATVPEIGRAARSVSVLQGV